MFINPDQLSGSVDDVNNTATTIQLSVIVNDDDVSYESEASEIQTMSFDGTV